MKTTNDNHITVKLGNKCNLHCKYCHNNCDDFKYNVDILDWLKENNVKSIQFSGGEPLLYFDIIKDIVNVLPENTKYMCVNNGTLLNENNIKFFNDHNFNVFFSYDGENDSRDKTLPQRFDLAPTIKNCGLSVLVSESNLYDTDKLRREIFNIKYKYKIGTRTDLFYPNFIHTLDNNYDYNKLKELANLYIDFVSNFIEYEIIVYNTDSLLQQFKRTFYDEKPYKYGFRCCHNGGITLTTEGNFTLCSYINTCVGDIYKGIDWELVESYKPERCKNCKEWSWCRNTCIANVTDIECYIAKQIHYKLKTLLS